MFCSYNLVFNGAPNNNNSVRVTSMYTNYHGRPTILNGGYIVIMQKKLTCGIQGITTRKQERFMWTIINITLEKNGCYMPSSLGNKSISVGRQAMGEMKNFAIQQLQF